MTISRVLHSGSSSAPFTAVICDRKGRILIAHSFPTREEAEAFLRDHVNEEWSDVSLLAGDSFPQARIVFDE